MPWKAVLDALPGMVGYWDAELRNVLANAACLDYFGLTAEQIRGMHISEALGPAVYAERLPYLTAALAGKRQDFERETTDRRGQIKYTQASYIPDEREGRVHGVYVLVNDVTARVVGERRLAEAAGRYRALARSMPDGFVLLFDPDLRFLVAEGSALEAFGFRSESLEGRTLKEALPPELAAELEPHYRAALAGEKVSWQRRVGDRVFTLTAGPVLNDEGEAASGMVVALDTTVAHRGEAMRAALQQLATAVARNTPWEQVVADIAAQLKDLFGADLAGVVKFTGPTTAEIVAIAPAGPPSMSRDVDFSETASFAAGQVARTGKPVIVDYSDDDDGIVGTFRSVGLLAGASAPIRLGDQLWGAVSIGTRSADRLTAQVLEELSSFAQLVEIALGNLQAWSALTRRASTDELTGLPNRATFDEALARELRVEQRPCSVIVVDVDEFKRFNDCYGHPVGDAVIKEVGRRLSRAARATDVLGRYGGDEFVWLLPGSTADDALRVAERARAAVSNVPFDTVGSVTISLGLCGSTDAGQHGDLLALADKAMYEAKRRGRNSVFRYQPETE